MPSTPTIGTEYVRISYRVRLVGFLSSQVAIIEGVEDGRRETVPVAELATYRTA